MLNTWETREQYPVLQVGALTEVKKLISVPCSEVLPAGISPGPGTRLHLPQAVKAA